MSPAHGGAPGLQVLAGQPPNFFTPASPNFSVSHAAVRARRATPGTSPFLKFREGLLHPPLELGGSAPPADRG